MTDRIAVYSGTRNLYPHMVVAAKSLLYHHGADTVYFLIEDDTFPEPLPDCIRTINVSGQSFFLHDSPNYNTPWTYMCLMRAAYHRLFPQKRILSLDVDTIVNKNIDPLWDLDISNAYWAGVAELYPGEDETKQNKYNIGVALFNLHNLRDGTGDRIISLLNTQYLPYPEQSAFNIICRNHIRQIPCEFNSMLNTVDRPPDVSARIFHATNAPKEP